MSSISRVALSAAVVVCLLQGCAVQPADPHLAAFSAPSPGKAAVYFYTWPVPLGMLAPDVPFVLNGKVLGTIGMAEWRRFEVEPGNHKYRMSHLAKIDMPLEFKPGETYFFRGTKGIFGGDVILTNHDNDVERIKAFIKAGRITHRE